MKKLFRSLFILSLSAAALGGCALDDFFGGNTKVADHIDVRDYSAEVYQNEKYTFDGKVYAIYEDETEEDVTSKSKFEDISTSKAGFQDLVVKYEDAKYIHKKAVQINVIEYIALQSISIPSSISVNLGETATVNPTFTPSNASKKDVTYTVGDSTIASVSSKGVITPLKKGNTTLTVTSTAYPNIKATASLAVKEIALQSISIQSSYKVKMNKTATVTPSFTPSNASNKAVNYTTGNSSVATISSSGVITPVNPGNTTVTVTSVANSSVKATANLTVAEQDENAEWTILLYMCGADLESGSAYYNQGQATLDLKEIDSVSGQPDDVNIVVQAGGASNWSSTYSSVVNANYRNRFHLDRTTGTYKKDSQESKVNMGLASTLQDFVTWGLDNYPADKVGLIFWNHGGGITGACFDEQFQDDGLTPDEMAAGISAGKAAAGYTDKFEFIGYDCCLMQYQDLAGLNAQYAKYQVASEESEWGYGWSYDKWIDDLYAHKTTSEILTALVDGFIEDTNSGYGSSSNDQTQSFLDLSKWSAYETAWESFASSLNSAVSDWSKLSTVLESTQRYGDYYDLFDIGDFIAEMKTSTFKNNSTLMSKLGSVETAYGNLVAYEDHGQAAGNTTGLALFAPVSGYMQDSIYSSSVTTLSTWRSFCVNKGNWYSWW